MKHIYYKYILLVVDYLLVFGSFILATLLHDLKLGGSPLSSGRWLLQCIFVALYLLATVFVMRYYHLYKKNIFLTVVRQASAISKVLVILTIGLMVLSFIVKSNIVPDSRFAILLFAVFSFTSLCLWRIVVFRWLFKWFEGAGILKKQIVIVGSSSDARGFVDKCNSSSQYDFKGFVSVDNNIDSSVDIDSSELLGPLEDLKEILSRVKCTKLILAYDGESHVELFDLIDKCQKSNANLYVLSSLLNVIPDNLLVEDFMGVHLVKIEGEGHGRVLDILVRPLDVVLSITAIFLLSPVFLALALGVRLSSKGPILYRQTRVGKNGSLFTFFKFRSMYLDSDKNEWRRQKTIDDIKNGGNSGGGSTKVVSNAAITPLGRLIRKTSLDELPQLYNVLRGDMSLVGPRPCLPYEWENYDSWHRMRLEVTPGCTGLWQVAARSKVGFNDSVVLDLYYIYNRNLWLFFEIILQTFRVMVTGKGGE